jgi:hexosaminidase
MKKTFIILLAVLFLLSCNQMKKTPENGISELLLEWEFLGNQIREGYSSAVFTLENNSRQTLGNRGWAIYFNQMGRGVIDESVTGDVRIEHVNGDLVRIIPGQDFKLEPGERAEINYHKPMRVLKENEAPLGPYLVSYDEDGELTSVQTFQEYIIKPFPSLDQVFPETSGVPLPDAAWVFEQNRHQSLLNPEHPGKAIPTPLEWITFRQGLVLEEGLQIQFGEGLDGEADFLAESLGLVMGVAPEVKPGTAEGLNTITLALAKDGEFSGESYILHVQPERGIRIEGGSAAGVFYGIQSLLAQLPVEVWAEPQVSIPLEASRIKDEPAFAYRGVMLDIARNYNDAEAIKKLIRIMGFYKLNKLHIHITDDEAWRLEIPSLPELTDVGSYRGHTETHKDHIGPHYGSGPVPEPGFGQGSGYISREAFIEILKLAADHHIEVIPEINFPGHARAAIYAMEVRYDRLMKEGKQAEAEEYRLIDPEDQSIYNSAQNFNDNVVCVCLESPYSFYAKVVDDIMDMYEAAGLKMRVMHAGGDEVPAGSWTASPLCESFMKEHPEISGTDNLQAYCEARLYEILEERNLVMAGWEEIAMKKDERGIWVPNPEFLDKQMLPYVWNNLGTNLDLGNRLANAGFPVILCNATNLYFDFGYTHHPAEPGHYWGGLVNTRRVFEFVPLDFFKSTTTDRYWQPVDTEKAFRGQEKLKPEAYENIVGLQGQLWSEFIKGGEMLEYFYMPKLIALAERAWTGQPEWGFMEEEKERNKALNDAWNEFANRVGKREMPRLDYLFGGFNYRLPPPGVIVENGLMHANIDFPGIPIRYTTDGTVPDLDSPLYSEPVKVKGKVRLRSFDTRGRGSRISEAD